MWVFYNRELIKKGRATINAGTARYLVSIGCTLFFCLMTSVGMAKTHPHVYGGIPSDGAYIERKGYIIQFDSEKKTPKWVAYHVKPSYTNTPDRKKSPWKTFRNDPDFQNEATEQDYKNQFHTWRNYAKGHLAPYFISGGDRDNDGINAEGGDKDDAKTFFEIMYMI